MIYRALHLDSDEHVILEVRKHWIVFAGQAFGLLLTGLFPIIFFALLRIFTPGVFNFGIPGNSSALFLFFYSLWLLAIWISFFVNWTKYYLDVWYVTEKRIIVVDQKRLFVRDISNVRFDKIQDITIDVDGFLPTLLGFGTVRVQTAGPDNSDLIMTVVHDPENVRQVIFAKHNEIGDKDNSV